MLKRYLEKLVGFSRTKTPPVYRAALLMFGAAVFLIIIPGTLLLLSRFVVSQVSIPCPREARLASVLIAGGLGLCLLAWAVLAQWRIGEGTPAPMAPTRKLVVSGPYQLCRNPIELGAVLYYYGLGALAHSVTAGLIMFLCGLLVGTCYHKFVEEKELLMRFGEEYLEYKRRTPFLIPRLRRWRTLG
jgi:protein-S-isoprenylcysteine O-methyltransferase Ste14